MEPPEPPRSPRKATRKLSEILLSTETGINLMVTGPVPANTFKSVERLSDAFGFGSTDAFESWFESDSFKLFYNELRENLKKYDDPSQPQRQGPQYAAVDKAIYQGERNGLMKYSSIYNLDLDEFTEIDFYALCVVKMSQFNQNSRDGAFFGKKMSLADIQCRLWHAILRANYNLPSRQARSKKTNLSIDLQNANLGRSGLATQAPHRSHGSSTDMYI
ncbi:hypothetical protein V491_07884 [Pseudogymnoascus sp. VKM F-3775]|nr:hypothetical protein V491_07884 [Pseudogymnoascus sp. VKM F-3775]